MSAQGYGTQYTITYSPACSELEFDLQERPSGLSPGPPSASYVDASTPRTAHWPSYTAPRNFAAAPTVPEGAYLPPSSVVEALHTSQIKIERDGTPFTGHLDPARVMTPLLDQYDAATGRYRSFAPPPSPHLSSSNFSIPSNHNASDAKEPNAAGATPRRSKPKLALPPIVVPAHPYSLRPLEKREIRRTASNIHVAGQPTFSKVAKPNGQHQGQMIAFPAVKRGLVPEDSSTATATKRRRYESEKVRSNNASGSRL